jgi:hypothetical protein
VFRQFEKDDDQVSKLSNLGRLFREIFQFAMQNKAWWIVPTVLILLLLGVLIFSGQAVAPFIYTLF